MLDTAPAAMKITSRIQCAAFCNQPPVFDPCGAFVFELAAKKCLCGHLFCNEAGFENNNTYLEVYSNKKCIGLTGMWCSIMIYKT